MKKIFLLSFLFLLLVSCSVNEPEQELLDRLDTFVSETGGVFEAEDGTLISLYTYHEKSEYTDDFETVKRLAEKSSVPVYVAFPPRKMDALAQLLPKKFPVEHSEYIFALAEETLKKSDAVYVDLYAPLYKSENTYYKTDHHWTQDGAYIAYREIVSAMGKKPLEKDFFKTELLIEKFRGSDHTKKPESALTESVYGCVPEGEYIVETVNFPYDSDENNEVLEGFFDYSKINSNEPYAVYLGGNKPYVRVRETGGGKDVLVIVRDSFANALATYLASHFDVVLVDTRFYPEGVGEIVEREGAFAVLVLENMGSVTESALKIKW